MSFFHTTSDHYSNSMSSKKPQSCEIEMTEASPSSPCLMALDSPVPLPAFYYQQQEQQQFIFPTELAIAPPVRFGQGKKVGK